MGNYIVNGTGYNAYLTGTYVDSGSQTNGYNYYYCSANGNYLYYVNYWANYWCISTYNGDPYAESSPTSSASTPPTGAWDAYTTVNPASPNPIVKPFTIDTDGITVTVPFDFGSGSGAFTVSDTPSGFVLKVNGSSVSFATPLTVSSSGHTLVGVLAAQTNFTQVQTLDYTPGTFADTGSNLVASATGVAGVSHYVIPYTGPRGTLLSTLTGYNWSDGSWRTGAGDTYQIDPDTYATTTLPSLSGTADPWPSLIMSADGAYILAGGNSTGKIVSLPVASPTAWSTYLTNGGNDIEKFDIAADGTAFWVNAYDFRAMYPGGSMQTPYTALGSDWSGGMAHGLVMNSDKSIAYLGGGSSTAGHIWKYDVSANTVIAEWGTYSGVPRSVSRDGSRLLLSPDRQSAKIYVVNTSDGSIISTLTTPFTVECVMYGDNIDEIWATSWDDGSVNKINAFDGSILHTLSGITALTLGWQSGGGGDTTAPTFNNASIATDGVSWTIHLTETQSLPILGSDGFTASIGGVAGSFSSVSISGTTITATCSVTAAWGQTCTLSYAPGDITDNASTPNAMTSFTNQTVTNSSIQVGSIGGGSGGGGESPSDVVTALAALPGWRKIIAYAKGHYTYNPSTKVITYLNSDSSTLFSETLTVDGSGNITQRIPTSGTVGTSTSDTVTAILATSDFKALFAYCAGKYTYDASTGVLTAYDPDGSTVRMTETLSFDSNGNITERVPS